MKKLVLLVLSSIVLLNLNAQQDKKELISKMFTGVITMTTENIDAQKPIESVSVLAEEKADKWSGLTKENISTLLSEAAQYGSVFIIVGNHTIVKIIDLKDCKPSGAWGACMPKGEGFIQKGELQAKTDYINFIIGVPDSQNRKIFMFN